ncbi:beta-1,4-glucuronyltransferase 1 [Carcharodon carcharias]|uniref:beta-1,4-glucuronyltransferase 1 n=1 Tax=Carcharodon carcharias TaxID=13397 RepID=UPI001B7F2379|nr:beta-1,4-glucuronyltransferase 1 [Carcharodon carcharias]
MVRLRFSLFQAVLGALLLVAALQLLYLALLSGIHGRQQRRRYSQLFEARGRGPGPGPGAGGWRLPADAGLDASGRYRLYRDVSRSPVAARAARSPGLELSLATHSSVHNLHQLPALVRRWQGPLAVAVFAPAGELLPALLALRRLELYCPGLRDTVTFTLVTPSRLRLPPYPPGGLDGEQDEAEAHWDPGLDSDSEPEPHPPCRRALAPLHRLRLQRRNYALGNASYPNNLLRNAARAALASRYVLLIDMDMLPSGGLHAHFLELMSSPRGAPPAADRTLFVLPALEIRHSRRLPWDKAELQRLYQVAEVRPFYSELCPRCQAPTNYSRWINLPAGGPGLRVAYTQPWTDPWEPFYISRATVPPYDERFEQYGFNRISQACELHVAGYTFAVLDNAFLIHKGFKLASEFHPQKDEENRRNRILFRQFKQELKLKYPDSPRRC